MEHFSTPRTDKGLNSSLSGRSVRSKSGGLPGKPAAGGTTPQRRRWRWCFGAKLNLSRRKLLQAELADAWAGPACKNFLKCRRILDCISNHMNRDTQISHITKISIAQQVGMHRDTVAKWCGVLESLGLIVQGLYEVRIHCRRKTYSVFALGAGLTTTIPAYVAARCGKPLQAKRYAINWKLGRRELMRRGFKVEEPTKAAGDDDEAHRFTAKSAVIAEDRSPTGEGCVEKFRHRTSIPFRRDSIKQFGDVAEPQPVHSQRPPPDATNFGQAARSFLLFEDGRHGDQWLGAGESTGDAWVSTDLLSTSEKVRRFKRVFNLTLKDLPSFRPAYGTPTGHVRRKLAAIDRDMWNRLVKVVEARPMLQGRRAMSNGKRFTLDFYWLIINAKRLVRGSVSKRLRAGPDRTANRVTAALVDSDGMRQIATLAALAAHGSDFAKRSAERLGVPWHLVQLEIQKVTIRRRTNDTPPRRARLFLLTNTPRSKGTWQAPVKP